MVSTVAEPHVHLWTRDEYYKMAEMGMFAGKHVQLMEGRIIEMSPMGSLHATGVSRPPIGSVSLTSCRCVSKVWIHLR